MVTANVCRGGTDQPIRDQEGGSPDISAQQQLWQIVFRDAVGGGCFAPGPSRVTGADAGADTAADFSSLSRYTVSEMQTIKPSYGNVVQAASPVFAVEGSTTAFNAVQGGVAACQAWDRFEAAHKIDNSPGMVEAGTDVARGATQMAAGALFAAYRPTSVVADLANSPQTMHSVSLVGRVSYWTGFLGIALFGVMYGILSIWCGWKLWRYKSFEQDLHKDKDPSQLDDAKNLQKYLQFFEKELGKTTEQTVLEQMRAEHGEGLSNKLKQEARLFLRGEIKALGRGRKKKVVEAIVDRMLEDAGGLPQDNSPLSRVERLGLAVCTARQKAKDRSRIAFAVSGECVQRIEQAVASNLNGRLGQEDELIRNEAVTEAQTLVKKVQQSVQDKKHWNWVILAASIIGLAAIIISCVCTGGIFPVVAGALFVLSGVLMLYVDCWVFFKPTLQSSSAPGKWDKPLARASTALGVASLVAVAVLASVSSVGIVPLVVALVIGVLWLMTSGISLHSLSKREKRFYQEHPSLESMSKEMQKAAIVSQETIALLKRLPKADRKAIKEKVVQDLFPADMSKREFVCEEDKELDRNHDFGGEFFYKTPKDPAVVKAVKKVMEKSPDFPSLRGLLLRIQNASEEDVRSYYSKRVSKEEQTAVREAIYRQRTESVKGRHFLDGISKMTVGELGKILSERQEENAQADQVLQDVLSELSSQENRR